MANVHVGKFRRGQIYTSAQLGVLGRMAVHSGHLVPYVDQLPSGRKRPARKKGKGWADGEVGVQAGSGEGVRDDSGAQGSQGVHGGDQPQSEA
jgi:hypothetical protein